MSAETLLDKRKVLIVDDEPDILETLEELPSNCDITTFFTFQDKVVRSFFGFDIRFSFA